MRGRPARLPAYSLFAAVLAGAGLPIYIYAPEFYASEHGVSLTALGLALLGLRALDAVQDPVLGWLAERMGDRRGAAVWIAGGVLAAAMWMLLGMAPPVAPLAWFALSLALLFSAFSFLTIAFYAQGVAKAASGTGHVRLAAWRETGSLLGVCVAAAAPTLLLGATDRPFAAYAAGFAALTAAALWAMRPEWTAAGRTEPVPARAILADRQARRLLVIALVNAAPVAVSSTLFLFYVEGVLGTPDRAGPLLLLFFLSAAVSAPVWSRLAGRFGARRVLLVAMTLSVLSFGTVLTLGPGDLWQFAAISVAGGFTIGADLTLLPALFARRMEVVSPNGGQGFGLWGTVSKATLAIAAAALLPILEASGFVSGQTPPEGARRTLTILYAGVPCALKLVAIALLARAPTERTGQWTPSSG
ncbi:MAG: MFS transporter [Hasllibacter sp.]